MMIHMPVADSPELRTLLSCLFPGIQIETNLRPTGQRVVYFCQFASSTSVSAQVPWAEWGNVVLKVSEGVDPSVIARMETEHSILNSLSSRNFPKQLFRSVYSEDPLTELPLSSRLFISIEQRVEGRPLGSCREDFKTERSVLKLLRDLVDALTLLWEHPKQIVHRDLKPDNILILSDGVPAVIDLGIAREQGAPGVTSTAFAVGPCTPAYASPEQIRNQKLIITYKADFFALGVIAYELLSGKNPFLQTPGDAIYLVLERAMSYEPPTLQSLSIASPPFSDLVAALMSKQPYRRPRTIADLRHRLCSLMGV